MDLLFTLCGRAGSKGIRNKNIKPFVGYPLPYYSLSVIDLYLKRYCDCNIDIAVNSDSPELVELIRNNPFRLNVYVVDRDPALAGDVVPKKNVISETLIKMQKKLGKVYDIVVDLDITSPLRTVDDLRNVIAVQAEKQADVTFSVTDSRRNPYFNMVTRVDKGYMKVIKSNFTSRQQAPQIYDMNASLYAWRPGFLLSDCGIFDGYCECTFMYDTGILDLDHEGDFELMQIISRYLFEKKEEFGEIYRNLEQNHNLTEKV